MGDGNNVVKVVKTVNTGAPVVKTIPINSQDAMNIARQNAMASNPQVVQPQQIVMTPINPNPNDNSTMNQQIVSPTPVMTNQQQMMNNQMIGSQQMMMNQQYDQQYIEDEDMMNDVNDLVKVVDVKYSKKTVLIMVAVIAALVIIFLVFELPMLMEM